MKNFTKGITLVALVVTIVVLLILAGITLTYVLGDNSVINKAKSAKLAQEQGSVLEYTRMKALTKVAEIENNAGYIDYLKTNRVIKSEVTGEAGETYYIVDPLSILSAPTYGKGSFETGDVYYILDGTLYYKSKESETKILGKIFDNEDEQVANANIFNYVTNSEGKIDIIGFNFNNINYQIVGSGMMYGMGKTIKVNMDLLEIPSQIDGKEVSTVYFHDNIGFDTPPSIEGIKKIIYPTTLKVLGSGNGWYHDTPGDCIFSSLEEVVLPEGLKVIEHGALGCNQTLKSVTIPASVERIEGQPFYGCSADLKIFVVGKESEEDFEYTYAYKWNCARLMYNYKSEENIYLTVEYLGK